MILPETTRELFESYDDETLLQSLFHPSLKQIRGRDYQFKKEILLTIPAPHQSLFMFISVYYHNTMGWESFMNAFSIYFPHGYLTDIKEGLSYLKSDELLDIIAQCEKIFYSDSPEAEKRISYDEQDERYDVIKEKSFADIATFVRKNAGEFVTFKD